MGAGDKEVVVYFPSGHADTSAMATSTRLATGFGFLSAQGRAVGSGRIAGVRLLPRDIPWSRFDPTPRPRSEDPATPATPKTRSYSLLVPDVGGSVTPLRRLLLQKGHTVVVMEPDFNGMSRGYDLVRDVATVCSLLARAAAEEGAGKARLGIIGFGLGASVGVLGASIAVHNHRLRLDGLRMPKHVPISLVNPIFGEPPAAAGPQLDLWRRLHQDMRRMHSRPGSARLPLVSLFGALSDADRVVLSALVSGEVRQYPGNAVATVSSVH